MPRRSIEFKFNVHKLTGVVYIKICHIVTNLFRDTINKKFRLSANNDIDNFSLLTTINNKVYR